MKKILFIALSLVCFSAKSQTQDLAKLAAGDYLGFNALFDDDDKLFGYISIYGYGKTDEKTEKFEYVLLDKNLNPVANKEFQGDITTASYYGYIDFRKKLILSPTYDYGGLKIKDFFYPRTMEVDIATNTVKPKIFYDYDHGKFIEITEPKNYKEERKEDKAEKKEKGFNYISYTYEIKEGGYLVFEYDRYKDHNENQSIMRYDEDKNLLWTYKYNENSDKKHYEILKILERDDNYIYAVIDNTVKNKSTYQLQVMDIKTGKIIATKPIDGLSSETIGGIIYTYSNNKNNGKLFDDKLVMVGFNYEPSSPYYNDGFSRITIDRKTFEIDTKVLNYSDFKTYVPKINEHGGVENGYSLKNRDLFFLEDGSVGVLMEKYKPGGNYTAPKTTDLVYAFTDKDFKAKGVTVFEKEKTKWITNSDYLFSQYLNEGKDVVFFYRDYQKDDATKEKNWNLFINTLIDGQFKQEMVPISAKDDYFVTPYVGKEGYILLREYNEKEKFNKIRLERLNY